MAGRPLAYIPAGEAAYIEALLRDPDSNSRKIGLQRLAHFYRGGALLRNSSPTKVTVRGLLYDESEKVRRWALNTLGLIGGARESQPIIEAIERDRGQPDVVGAGVAALAAVVDPAELTRILASHDFAVEGTLLLAVAQRTDAFDEQLRQLRLDIEKSAPHDLRMGTLLVGLGRAPENLFSTKHSNRKMIGHLNDHHDPIVAQYSVWATVENPLLGLNDLMLALRDVEAQPSNVRGWIYRLIGSSVATAEAHLDILQMASQDSSAEAREGLAAGLRHIHSAEIERLVVEWFLTEQNESVKQRLLEHMASVGDSYPRYGELVLGTYRAAGNRSLVRTRLEAAAQGSQLYTDMKVVAHEAEGDDLFGAGMGKARSATMVRGSQNRKAAASSKSLIDSGENEGFPAVESVRVLIVTALPLEEAAVLATVDRYQKVGSGQDPNIYYLGVYEGSGDRPVIICSSGMGKANASVTAANALRTHPQVEHVIMVGIAGGCPNANKADEHVRLGDIVISGPAGILEYDFVKQTDEARQIRAFPQKPAAKALNAANSLQATEYLGERPWEQVIEQGLARSESFARPADEEDVLHDNVGNTLPHPDDTRRRSGHPRVHIGMIGTADTLQKDPAARDELRDRFGVRAIEMEGSGIQSAAWASDKDIFVVRGICDYCDRFKNDKWQGYAALVAAAYTKSLVEAMPKEWFPAEAG